MKKLWVNVLISFLVFISACNTENNHEEKSIIVAYRVDNIEVNLVFIEPESGIYKNVKLPRDNSGVSYSPENKLWIYADRGSIYAFDDQKNQEIKLFQTQPIPSYPVLSPDGKQIAFSKVSGWDTDLCVYDLEDKTETVLLKISNTLIIPNDWSKDGDQILISKGNFPDAIFTTSSIALISRDGKEIDEIYRLPEPSFVPDFQFSPDKKYIIMEIRNPDGIALFDIENNQEVELSNIPEESRSPVWSPDGERIAYIHENKIFVYTIETAEITKVPVPEDHYITLFWLEKP